VVLRVVARGTERPNGVRQAEIGEMTSTRGGSWASTPRSKLDDLLSRDRPSAKLFELGSGELSNIEMRRYRARKTSSLVLSP